MVSKWKGSMRYPYFFMVSFYVALTMNGCAPAVIAGGAAGGYKVATDERTMGRMVDDATITTRVKTALIEDEAVPGRKIDVDTVNGAVTLTGVVNSGEEARQAVRVARNVSGVRSVTNNLQTGSTTVGQYFDDRVISGKIKAKLLVEPDIRALNIDVDVDRGVATLTGVVASWEEKRRAIGVARSVGGVRQVVDNLTIK